MTIKKLVREVPIKKKEQGMIPNIVQMFEKQGYSVEQNCKGLKIYALEETSEAVNNG